MKKHMEIDQWWNVVCVGGIDMCVCVCLDGELSGRQLLCCCVCLRSTGGNGLR